MGQWCPACSAGFGERVVLHFFQLLFNKPFPKIRPDWLRGSIKGPALELDGYNKELALAFEHQGSQHYNLDPIFSNTVEKLAAQKKRDALKLRLCEMNGVTLITIPEVPSRVKLEEVKDYILGQLKAAGKQIMVDNIDQLFADRWWYPTYFGHSPSARFPKHKKDKKVQQLPSNILQ